MPQQTIGQRVQHAIEIECTAIKAGNVHPLASFNDLQHAHFMQAAKVVGHQFDSDADCSVGAIVLRSTRAMVQNVGTNTSLGTILLLAPLAVAMLERSTAPALGGSLQTQVRDVLNRLCPEDAREIYQAIRIAKPGGLGKSESMDVEQAPPARILDAMRFASQRDDVALQYVTDFELVFDIASRLMQKIHGCEPIAFAIRELQIELLSERVDSLIVRKCGMDFAESVKRKAFEVRQSGPFLSHNYLEAWNDFDRFLRDEPHRGNPGTTADLIAAAIFVSGIGFESRI